MTQLELDLGDITIQPDLFDTVSIDTGDIIVADYSNHNMSSGAYTIDTSTVTMGSFTYDDNFGNSEYYQHIQEQLDAINERLAILHPNPEHLEKYEALRNAYEHYKTLEHLIKNG